MVEAGRVPTLSDFPYWFTVAFAVSLGLAFGSFLNVVIYRLPRGESVVHPPSRCPKCGTRIGVAENIPVFGWILLRGRARCCKAEISIRYPVVEALGGVLAWAVLESLILTLPPETPWWGATVLFGAYLALSLGLVAAVFIDFEHMLLPDEITVGGTALAFATVPLREMEWTTALAGAAFGYVLVWLPFYVLYRWLRGHPGMGLGDAKLLMLAGAWFGFAGALFALLAGAVQGTIFALAVLLVKGRLEEPEAVRKEREELKAELSRLEGEERRKLEEELALDPLSSEPEAGLGKARIPFGPFLALATLEYLYFGDVLIEGYLSLVLG